MIGCRGTLPTPTTVAALATTLGGLIGSTPLVLPGGDHPVQTVGIVSGGAARDIRQAAAAGLDAFITGEISEPQAHLAQETGVAFLACGHHATERYGAPALAAHVASQLGLAHAFIDIGNPA